MHNLISPHSFQLIAHFSPLFHEGEGNFELYVNIIQGVGGLQGFTLSLLWLMGGLYFSKKEKYFSYYVAFAGILHFLLVKGNLPVYIADLGMILFIYSLVFLVRDKLVAKTS